ncbi:MAG TPA: tripartite tricarboxylate transporter substrate binding protein [Hyphomicrobiaceae bacterium]|nr:tripartite tricarboxylate transporter substrate binding protein [Hyphomicrobiaceae bacterium]
MKRTISRRDAVKLAAAGVAAAAISKPAIVRAQSYPSKPINVVVPFATGGYNDRLARAFAPHFQRITGQPWVVVNRGGSGALLGHTYFLQQPDDGYTICCTSAAPYIPLNIYLQNATFKLEDFHMINLPSRDYTLMATTADSPLKSIQDVLAKLKADPASLSIGIQPNSADYVNLMLFADANKIPRDKLRLVTYDGGGPTRNATAGGVVNIGLVGGEGFLPIASKIRPLLTFDDRRQKPFDAAPAVTEVVGKDAEYVAGSQRGWAVHATLLKKHPDVYKALLAALEKTSKDKETIESLEKQQLATDWFGPEESNASFRRTAEIMKKHVSLLKA